MNDTKVSLKRIVILGGSIISFAIGAGFATGQELMQFYVPYGFYAFLSAIAFFCLNVYINYNYLQAGRITGAEKGTLVLKYFCGKYVGTFFDYFTIVFIFMSYFVMVAGAGATLNQCYGVPGIVGAGIVAALAAVTVMFGLNKMVDVIGMIGPVIIVLVIVIAVAGIVSGDTGVVKGNEILPQLKLMSVGSNWFTAIISYVGFGMLWFVSFIAAMGKNEKNFKTAFLGNVLGVGMLTIAVVLVVLALLANIELVAHSQIPMLAIVNSISPVFAAILAIVIFTGIYTTACPLLWTVCNRLATEGTTRYKVITAALAAIGFGIGMWVPFSKLVNIVYGINGYIGFVLFAFIVIRHIRRIVENKKSPVSDQQSE